MSQQRTKMSHKWCQQNIKIISKRLPGRVTNSPLLFLDQIYLQKIPATITDLRQTRYQNSLNKYTNVVKWYPKECPGGRNKVQFLFSNLHSISFILAPCGAKGSKTTPKWLHNCNNNQKNTLKLANMAPMKPNGHQK